MLIVMFSKLIIDVFRGFTDSNYYSENPVLIRPRKAIKEGGGAKIKTAEEDSNIRRQKSCKPLTKYIFLLLSFIN